MVYASGILPIPKSPIIKDGAPTSYIKPSYYPIPYQATIAIENCDIHEVLSWDISVNVKSIKIKVDWSLAKDNNGTTDLFPKAVYNSISSYNIGKPIWSSSFSNSKLSLKVEWKIIDPNTSNTPHVIPLSPIPYNDHLPGHSFITPGHLNDDSRYGSPNISRTHHFNVSTPAAKLIFPSPKRNIGRHDVYRSIPKSPSTNLQSKPGNDELSKSVYSTNPVSSAMPSSTNNITSPQLSQSKPKSIPVIPTLPVDGKLDKSSSTNYQSKSSIPVIPSSTNTNTLPQPLPTLPVDVILDNTNPKSPSANSQSKPSIPVIPSSTNTNTLPHPLPTVRVNETKPIPDPDRNSLPVSQSISNPNPPTSSIIPDSTNSKSGDADELYSDSDYDPFSDFEPRINKFARPPKNLRFSTHNYLHDDIYAEFMNLIGECRLCNSQVPSYLAQLHVFECPKANKKIINTFAKKFAKSLKLSKDTVCNIAKDHVAYKYTDNEVPNKDFKTLDQFRNFCKALDTATDSQTKSFFEQCNLPCSRDVNILKYEHLK